MKQLAAILLIVIFAFSQYAKQFAYMECKISNSTSKDVVKCDCEKKYDIHTVNDKVPPTSQSHTHPSLIDDVYATPVDNEINYGLILLIDKFSAISHSSIAQGFNGAPFRPPQV